MAYSTISKPGLHFNTKLYSGSNGTQNVTGVGFQPDFTWLKCRSSAYHHRLFDVVRGVNKNWRSNSTDVEQDIAEGVTAFASDGYSVTQGANLEYNASGQTYVSWNWKADNTSGSSNSNGSITSTVSANTVAGFSIVSYTGNATNSASFGHGLGVKPKIVFIKNRSTAKNPVWWQDTTNNGTSDIRLVLSSGSGSNLNNYHVTFGTDTITLGNTDDAWNKSGDNLIAYCFAEKKGYSKFGRYIGNGNANGTFVYTGFKPAFILQRRYSSGESWHIFDSARDTFNVDAGRDDALRPNLTNAEITNWGVGFDFLSNGFKARATDGAINQSGGDYLYMAFAQEPLVANVGGSIPATAE
jgi:hypothetical protein